MPLTVGLASHARRTAVRTLVTVTLGAFGATLLPCVALAQPSAATAPLGLTETLVLRVKVNTESKGDLFVQRGPDGDFLLKLEDLTAIGFKEPEAATQVIEGEAHVSLRAIRGLAFTFDGKELTLHITADPALLPSTTLNARAERRRGTVTRSGDSAFLNYALASDDGSAGSKRGISLTTEAGVRWGEALLISDASTVDTASGRRFVRLTSSLLRDDRENLRRWVLGDVITPARDFSNNVNLGGISVSKLYGLDPYYVRFPTQSLTGSVTVPSEMEVYIDGQRVRTERLRPGEFDLQDILGYGGARNVQVLLRDAFGRVQQLNYSLYFTEQPLRKGLHEYSYHFGAIRRDFGTRSNVYGPAAVTMFHRYGFSKGLTLGWRAEAQRGFLSTGPTLTGVLGALGVVNLGTTLSRLEGRQGSASLASYNFDSQRWATGLFIRHDSRNYASLGDPPEVTRRRYEGSLSATYRLPRNASVSLSRTVMSSRPGAAAPSTADLAAQALSVLAAGKRQVSALSFSTPLDSNRMQLTATVSRVKDSHGARRTEGFLSLNIQIGRDYSAAASYRSDRRTSSESLRFTKSQPVGEGLGYDLTVNRTHQGSDSTQARANLQYNAPAAVLRAEVGHYDDEGRRNRDQRVSLAGGIIAAGGYFAASRPVTQSYALVKVGDLPGVGIFVDGQPVAHTGRNGLAAVPSLNAYYENSVSVDTDGLPMNYSLPAAVKRIVPSHRSGAFMDFNIKRTQAFSGKLVGATQGMTTAIEFAEVQLQVAGERRALPTGRGGEFYVENLQPGTYPASVTREGAHCGFDLKIPASEEMFVDLGQLQCLRDTAGTTSNRRD